MEIVEIDIKIYGSGNWKHPPAPFTVSQLNLVRLQSSEDTVLHCANSNTV